MEQSNTLDTEKLNKIVEDIFAGGEKAVAEFDYSAYTIEELKYIMHEMDEQTIKEIDELIEIADEYDKERDKAQKAN
ncbi:MAG: hypothetical protein LBK05_05100 [Treponema sp.]|jgi:hypothetical protein|nr:hypothetical protein [Treponema sp.]